MFKVVVTVFQQIMTELNGAESEADRIMPIREGAPHDKTLTV
jgi:hypothetical protein